MRQCRPSTIGLPSSTLHCAAGHVLPLPHSAAAAVQHQWSAPSRFVAHAAQDSQGAGSDDEGQSVRRRRRLFRAGTSSSTGDNSSSSSATTAPAADAAPAAPAKRQAVSKKPQQPSTSTRSSLDVLEDFAAAFESLALAPKTRQPSLQRGGRSSSSRSDQDDDNFSYLGRDPALRREQQRGPGGGSYRDRDGGSSYSSSSNSERDGRSGLFGRTSGSGTYGSIAKQSSGSWLGRGKQSSKGKGKGPQPMTLEDFEGVNEEELSPDKQRLLESLRAKAAEAERRRLIRKERSERIPTAPKRTQDPILFQALTRKWDEKMTHEELRGARATARKVARVGLYDRNHAMKAVRRKVVQAVQKKPEEELTEEERIIAARAKEIRNAAAALSIQPTKEQLAEEAKGVGRSYARAQALPEGLWEELKDKADVIQIKLGRRGATPSLISAVQNAWRSHEVVKLRIHDDKSSRKTNLPRVNLLLRELEEMSGGVLLDAQGSSIWLYRGLDWQPPPITPPYVPPPAEELLQQQYTPKGSWRDISGVTCYVTSSGDGSSSDGSCGAVQPAATDAMTLLMLPDHFAFADSQALLQVADWFARKGALVVLADVLGAPPDSVNGNIQKAGLAPAGYKGTDYWPMHRWPLVKKRKLEYMAWFQTGPGSWQQQRPKLLALLEAMQQQGLYDPDAAAPAAAAAADAPPPPPQQQQQQQQQQEGEDAAGAEASSSRSGGVQAQAQVTGRPLGLLGLSWGSFIGLHAAGDEAVVAAGVKVLAALSPATYNRDYDITVKLQLPVALLPAKYDVMDQVMMFINLLAKPWEMRCVFKRFGKVKPGWSSWLPQWEDPRAMRQVTEQMLTALSWLRREMLGVQDGYELPEPQLPAKTTSQAAIDAAAAQAAKNAAAEQAEAEADAASG